MGCTRYHSDKINVHKHCDYHHYLLPEHFHHPAAFLGVILVQAVCRVREAWLLIQAQGIWPTCSVHVGKMTRHP